MAPRWEAAAIMGEGPQPRAADLGRGRARGCLGGVICVMSVWKVSARDFFCFVDAALFLRV